MNKLAAWRTLAIVICLVGCGRKEPTPAVRMLEPPARPGASPDPLATALVRAKFTSPQSPWQDAEKAQFAALLATAHADVLVVPFQVQGNALDRIERMLMTAALSDYIGASGKTVLDPFLVARALGDGQRLLADSEIEALAKAVGARTIIRGFVGHDARDTMSVQMDIQRDQAKDRAVWPGIAYSDDDLPYDKFMRMLPDVAKRLGFTAVAPTPAAANSLGEETADALPATIAEIYRASDMQQPHRAALQLELLGLLHPDHFDRYRDRAFEKALLALAPAQATPLGSLLKARALLHLRRRPAAIAALGEATTPEGQALRAAMDGNLPELESQTAKISSPLLRFMASVEANDLRASYDAMTQKIAHDWTGEWVAIAPAWETLIRHRAGQWDYWQERWNVDLKLVLDREFPLEGFTAASVLKGQLTMGKPDVALQAAQMSVHEHQKRLLTDNPRDWCCQRDLATATRWQLFDLLQADGESALAWRVSYYQSVQGRPDDAAKLLAEIDPIFGSEPRFAELKMLTTYELRDQAEGAARAAYAKQGEELAHNVLYWEQGASRTSYSAAWRLAFDPGRKSWDYVLLAFDSVYGADFPPNPDWQLTTSATPSRTDPAAIARRLAYAISQYDLVETRLRSAPDEATVNTLLTGLGARFSGSPRRVDVMAKRLKEQGQSDEVAKLYRDAIRQQPDRWEPYYSLGELLVNEGKFDAAQKLFLDFPGFKPDSGAHPVGLSNDAFSAGSLFYWRGEYDRALPLYRLSAGYQTGSAASMGSIARLQLLRGDFEAAAQSQLERGNRYHYVNAYRDFLSLAFALGHGEEAWSAFDSLVGQFNTLELWSAAWVGHRIGSTTDEALDKWLLGDRIRHIEAQGIRVAAVYAFMAHVIDRKPEPGLGKLLEQLDVPATVIDNLHTGMTVNGQLQFVGPSEYPQKVLGEASPKRAYGTAIRPMLAMFADAYSLLRSGDYEASRKAFEELSRSYTFEDTSALPYFARAVARTGKGAAMASYLAEKKLVARGFDVELAQAFLAGAAGMHADAAAHLKSALWKIPPMEARPVFPEYQYAEACEWLLEDSGDVRYRDLLLDWLRKVERIEPTMSWAYAMEARYTPVSKDRIRALAVALYLDPLSAHASAMPAADRRAATAWLQANNPFKAKPSPEAAGT